MSKLKQRLPRGWTEERVQSVIDHYENQTEEEQFAEIEAALKADGFTMMAIPIELEADVRALLARSKGSGRSRRKPPAKAVAK